MCNGDSQGRGEEEEMDWEPSSHNSQPFCGGGGPNSSACANSSPPHIKQESGDVKAEADVCEDVKVKVESDMTSGSSIKSKRESDNIPKSENGVVSGKNASSGSSASGTFLYKQELGEAEEATVNEEGEHEEEDDDNDVEITGPAIGDFELIADSVDSLRQVVEELEQPEAVVSKRGKRKVTKLVPRKPCDQALAARMRESVEELSVWEGRLNTATGRARLKIRREYEDFKAEESLQSESHDWETDPSFSGNEDDHQASGDAAQSAQADLQGGTESSMDTSSEVWSEGTASPAPMEYEIEFSSRGRMRKKKTNFEDRPVKRLRTGDSSEDSQSASRLPNILQRQNKAMGPQISILPPPGRAGLSGATIQVAVPKAEVSSAQFSASQLLKLSQSRVKAAIGIMPNSRPALLRAPLGGSSKTGSHPVIQQLLSKQPQFSARAPTASSLLVRQQVVRPQSVVVSGAVAASTSSPTSNAVNVQYILTNNTQNTNNSSGTSRTQQTISMTPAMLQQLLHLTQVCPQGSSSAGNAARVLTVSQQPSDGPLKTTQTPKPPQTVLLTSQSVTPSTPSPTQPASDSDTSPTQQVQLSGALLAAAGGLKGLQNAKYASNVTVKALLENRAAQKAGVPVQGGTSQIVLAANSAGVPTLLSRVQPVAVTAKPAKVMVQVPAPITKTFSGDLDSAVRLVVTSVSTSLPTANIHVPSPALSPNLPRGAPAKTIMTSVMEQPIVTTKVLPLSSQTPISQTTCLTAEATAQAAPSVSGVKLASPPTLTISPSSQKAVLCKVVQPGGQSVLRLVVSQGSLQHLSGSSPIQLGPTTTVAGSSALSLSPSTTPGTLSPVAQQAASVKVLPAPSAAKQLILSPQSRLVQAPAAALVKQIAASQLAQAGSLVRVHGSTGSLAAGQAAGNLSATPLLQQLSPGADQAAVGQPAGAASQVGQILKAAGLGKAGYVFNITPNPATQQRLQAMAVENSSSATTNASTLNSISVSNAGAATSPGLAQVPQFVLPQQSPQVLNLQLLQSKLAGLAQGQAAASLAGQPTRVVLMAPGSSQATGLTQNVLQQASPQLNQQIIARGINASLAGQPQIVLTPSAGSAAAAKAQVLGQSMAVRNPSGAVTLVSLPSSVGLGVARLSELTSAVTAPAMATLSSVRQASLSGTPGSPSSPLSVATLQQLGLKVAGAAVSPANQTSSGMFKPSTAAPVPLTSHSMPQGAASNSAAQSTVRIAGRSTAAVTSSSNAAPATRPAAEATQKIRLLRVNSQLYTAEGIPVAVGTDGQLRALPLPHILLPASLQQAMLHPEASLETSAAGVAPSTPGPQPSPAQLLAVSGPSDPNTSSRAASSICGPQPVLSHVRATAATAASTGNNLVTRPQQSQTQQQQQQQPRNVGDGLLLINFAQSNQKS